MQRSLARMAREEPELAAKVLRQRAPGGGRIRSPGRLDYRLVLDGLGSTSWPSTDGRAEVTEEHPAAPNGHADFTLETDPETFARLAAGTSPLRLMLGGKLRVSGKRRRALKLRRMEGDLTMRDIVRAGRHAGPGPALPGAALRHRPGVDSRAPVLRCSTSIEGDDSAPGGEWFVRRGRRVDRDARDRRPRAAPDSIVRMSHDTWLALVRGDLIPNEAMRRGLVRVDGRMFPVTLMGRWIERSEGRDDAELEREIRQAAVQNRRATWGSRRGRCRAPAARATRPSTARAARAAS